MPPTGIKVLIPLTLAILSAPRARGAEAVPEGSSTVAPAKTSSGSGKAADKGQQQSSAKNSTEDQKAELESLRKEQKALTERTKSLEQEKAALNGQVSEQKQALQDQLTRYKFINVSFGVLPNSNNQVNNVASVALNYQPGWTTKAQYFSRTTSSRQQSTSETPISGTPGTSSYNALVISDSRVNSIDRTDASMDVLRYTPRRFDWRRGSLAPTVAIGATYAQEITKTSYSDKANYKDLISGAPTEMPINGNLTNKLQSVEPNLSGDIDVTGVFGIKGRVSGGLIFLGRDKTKYSDIGSFQVPSQPADPTKNLPAQASQYSDFNLDAGSGYKSKGFMVAGDLEWSSPRWGGIGVHYFYKEKWGDTKSYKAESTPGEGRTQNRTLVVSSIFEERINYRYGLSYSMTYLERLGVLPSLRVNGQVDRVIQTPTVGARTDTRQSTYDFGFEFAY